MADSRSGTRRQAAVVALVAIVLLFILVIVAAFLVAQPRGAYTTNGSTTSAG